MKKYFFVSLCVLLCLQTGCGRTEQSISLQEDSVPGMTFAIHEGTIGGGVEETTQEKTSAEQSLERKKAFEGEWSRTEVPRSLVSNLVIHDVDAAGFEFELISMYYSHFGEVRGKGVFESETRAVAQFEDVYWESAVLVFEMKNDTLNITLEEGDLPFGANVTADGAYVKGEPLYTNENIMAETFTEEELQIIRATIADDEVYEDFFCFCVEYGVLSVEECRVKEESARLIEGFVPTMGGYGFQMILTENGEAYVEFDAGNIPFKTNVAGADKMPEHTN